MTRLLGLNLCSALQAEITEDLGEQDGIELLSLSDSDQRFKNSPTELLEGVEAVVLGPDTTDPIQLSQVLTGINNRLALLILCAPEHYQTLCRNLQFAPYIGREVRCRPHEKGKLSETLDELLQRARQRRLYKSLLENAEESLKTLPPPPKRVEPFLHELMEALPVGVVLLEKDLVLARNTRADDLVQLTIGSAVPAELKQSIAGGCGFSTVKLGNRTIEIQYSRLPEKRRATEIIILHDVTELVEVRQEIVEVRARAITAEAQAQAAVQLQELNEALKNAKDEALAASKAKSAFLANMSHELRTPLNAIIGFGEILKDETFGDLNKKQSRHISNVLQSGYHLLRLINDLLDIAKIEAGRVVLELEKVSLSTAVSQVVNVLEGLAAENKVSLKFNSPGELPVHADGARLNQILFNLINNGIKFSPNGVVEITLFEDGPATARVRVADTGRGLSREDLGRVFGRFEQVDPGRQEGTGLGLAITHKLVELHGGNIWVESDGPGKGCQFHFTLNRFL